MLSLKTYLAGGSAIVALLAAMGAVAAPQSFDIPSEPAAKAIADFARQAGVQLIAPVSDLHDVKTPAIRGSLEPHEALVKLLAGTGLEIAGDNGAIITLRRIAAGTGGEGALPNNPAPAARSLNTTVEIITVTAEKETEVALDVPMGLTAIGGETLRRDHASRFEDYVGTVPGLTVSDFGSVGTQLIIRGLSSGLIAIQPSAAVYLDETPYSVEGPFAAAYAAAPNLDTFDMNRIEVLKGPQGTLYGANALGGLLKYVTNAPDPSAYSAKIEAGAGSVYNGGIGFDLHGMINVPLAADTAFRLVLYESYYPGFIDDPGRGLNDINGSHTIGGRASLLWQPTSDFSLRLNGLYQDHSYSDWSALLVAGISQKPVSGQLDNAQLVSQPGFSLNQIYNATADYDAGFATLVSTTSYSVFQTKGIWDYSGVLGQYATKTFGPPNYGLAILDNRPAQIWTQELRVSSPEHQMLTWQLGGYFTSETSHETEFTELIDPATHKILYGYVPDPAIFGAGETVGGFIIPTTYREFAGYANVDYHATPTIDFAIGGRYSHNSQTFSEAALGVLGGGIDIANTAQEGVLTYSGDARWHFAPNAMLYLRLATGFVPGGPNDVTPTIKSLPPSYGPSTTTNYEWGVKSTMLDGALTAELSAYQIDWHDIQLEVLVGGYDSITNGGTAHSDGLEWNFAYVPLPGLTLNFNGDFDDAILTTTTANGVLVDALKGGSLPYVPQWQSSAGAEYERRLTDAFSGFAGVAWRMTGSRRSDFTGVGPRQDLPTFMVADLRAGIENAGWSFAVYCKNVGNTIAVDGYYAWNPTGSGYGNQYGAISTPRTVGAELSANF